MGVTTMIPNRNLFCLRSSLTSGMVHGHLPGNDEVSSSARGTSIKWQDVTVCDTNFDVILGSNKNTLFKTLLLVKKVRQNQVCELLSKMASN